MSIENAPLLTKSVGIWIRVSTDDQAQGDSPKHHEARARHYAAAKDWNVAEVYDLAGVSGKSVIDHPETKRMMEDIRKGRISGLIFSKLARLTRNARELMDFSDFFRTHDADLVSLQENIDTGTPSGRLFYNIVAVMSQWEREEIASRVSASVSIRAKLGKPLGGQASFGYTWRDKKLVPHPDEAPVRKLMYELFAEHKRMKTVARLLNERGFRTRDGSHFSDTTVDRLIRDPTAKGIHRTNYTQSTNHKKAWALKPEHDWIMTEVEPIIPVELWEQCNSLLEARKTKRERPGKRPVHLFAGLILCACGTKMYVPSDTAKYVCQACRNKIPIVDMENIFLDELKAYLLSPERVAEYLKGANAAIEGKTQLLDGMKRELQKVRQEAERLYRLYMDEGLTSQQFKEFYQPIDARKKQLEEEIPRAEAEADLLRIDGLSSEYIMAEVKDLHGAWPRMNVAERRDIVELLVKKIIVGKDEIDISLCYVPSFKELSNRQRMVTGSSPQSA